jgi:signal transduction histidine kinase
MTLDDFGLIPALDEHIKHFKEFYPDIQVDSNLNIGNTDIPEDVQTVLYRVFQESLNNIGKHSGASRVRVDLSNHECHCIEMQIADNGCGFDPQDVMASHDSLMGFGLHSMRERIEICHGQLNIQSEPGRGTSIDVAIPL